MNGKTIIALACAFLMGCAAPNVFAEAGSIARLSGSRIDSVAVAGADSVHRKELDGLLFSKRGGFLNEGLVAHDIDVLAAFFRDRGWWNAAARADADTSGGKTTLRIVVDPGARTYVGTVRLTTGGAIPDGGFPVLPNIETRPFIRATFDEMLRALVTSLTERGYPGAEVHPRLAARGDTVDVALDLRPGARAHLDSIVVRGLFSTKDRVIVRGIAHLLGRPASPEISEQARTALSRLRFVRLAVDPVVEYTEDGRGILVVTLEETARNAFEGVLGYQPSATGGSGGFVGKADLTLQNLFGTGRAVRTRWENLGGDSQDMEVRFEEPWAFGLPFGVEGGFAQERRPDRGYTRTLMNLGVSRSAGRLTGRAGFRSESVSADTLASSSASGIDAGIEWNALDNPMNPRSGVRYTVERSYVRKRYRFGGGDRANLDREIFTLEHYLPLFRNQAAALLLDYRRAGSGGRPPDPADRWWLGGASTIRGYRERIFPAERAFLATMEWRVLTGPASRAFLFLDSARLWNSDTTGGRTVMTVSNPLGYGFGLRVESAAGMLGFDYGLGKGDTPGEGKLHIRISTAF